MTSRTERGPRRFNFPLASTSLGLPTAKLGCVVTLTVESPRPGFVLKNTSLPSDDQIGELPLATSHLSPVIGNGRTKTEVIPPSSDVVYAINSPLGEKVELIGDRERISASGDAFLSLSDSIQSE